MSEPTNDLKQSIIQSVLDRKFSRANVEFANLMKDKAYAAIDDFKNAFKYVAIAQKEPVKVETQPAKKETKKKEK